MDLTLSQFNPLCLVIPFSITIIFAAQRLRLLELMMENICHHSDEERVVVVFHCLNFRSKTEKKATTLGVCSLPNDTNNSD
jgi:hypothetical protein